MSKAKQETKKIFEVILINEYGVFDGSEWFNFSKFGRWEKGQGISPDELEEGKKYLFILDSRNPKFINEIHKLEAVKENQKKKVEKETSKIEADERDIQIARMNALKHAVEIIKHNSEIRQETILEEDVINLANRLVNYIITGE